MMERRNDRKVAGAVEAQPDPCELALMWPLTFEYLTCRKYGDGTARKPSSLLLFTDGGLFKVMLKDPDAGLCCWVAGRSLAGAFAALEAALCDPEHEWRTDRQQSGDTARRVKR